MERVLQAYHTLFHMDLLYCLPRRLYQISLESGT